MKKLLVAALAVLPAGLVLWLSRGNDPRASLLAIGTVFLLLGSYLVLAGET